MRAIAEARNPALAKMAVATRDKLHLGEHSNCGGSGWAVSLPGQVGNLRCSCMLAWATVVPGGGGSPTCADAKLDVLVTHPVARSFRRPTLSPPPWIWLLTVCSQTVRILLDVVAHVLGKHAGQAHNGGRVPDLVGRVGGVQIPASRSPASPVVSGSRSLPAPRLASTGPAAAIPTVGGAVDPPEG